MSIVTMNLVSGGLRLSALCRQDLCDTLESSRLDRLLLGFRDHSIAASCYLGDSLQLLTIYLDLEGLARWNHDIDARL